jgi:hypothetical protein
MNLKETLEKLKDPATSPGELSEIQLHLSADYASKAMDLQEILALKAARWPELREIKGSDKHADKGWDATSEGIAEMGLRLQLKSLEKLMSSIKAHLRIKETESRNLM